MSNKQINAQKEIENTTGIIRIRTWKDRQHNDQKKKDQRTNNDKVCKKRIVSLG
jgi:hypothetical protein